MLSDKKRDWLLWSIMPVAAIELVSVLCAITPNITALITHVCAGIATLACFVTFGLVFTVLVDSSRKQAAANKDSEHTFMLVIMERAVGDDQVEAEVHLHVPASWSVVPGESVQTYTSPVLGTEVAIVQPWPTSQD